MAETASKTGRVIVSAQRCWDGLTESPIGRSEVLVQGERIVEVGPRVEHGGAEVIDLGELMLLPGFIDCHVHTTMNPARMLQPVVSDAPTVMALDAVPVLRTMLLHGFTTVRDLGTLAGEPIGVYLRDAVARGDVDGPRMVVAPHVVSSRGGHGDITGLLGPQIDRELGALADGATQIASLVRREIRCGADWVKFAATGGFGSPSDDPGQATYSQEEMNVLVATASDLGVPCTPHAYGDEGIQRALRAGVRSIEHGNMASQQTLATMAEQQVFLVPTQYMVFDALEHLDDDQYWLGKTPEERDKFGRYADQLRECARNLADSAVPIAFGTDAGMFPHRENWREFPTLVGNGIATVRALRAATSVAADLLGRPDLGRIAPSARADLIAVSGNPFDDITDTSRVVFVMKSGTVYAR